MPTFAQSINNATETLNYGQIYQPLLRLRLEKDLEILLRPSALLCLVCHPAAIDGRQGTFAKGVGRGGSQALELPDQQSLCRVCPQLRHGFDPPG